jgi:exopolysaccharide biosynthesis protein
VGAGPRLLRNGVVEITADTERFKPDIRLGRKARTGLGVTRDGRVLLLAVEDPGPYGGGATLEELAELLKARGAVEAMNLDGGGSTTLAIGPVTVTAPPGAWTRPVASGVLVFDDRMVPPAPPVAPVTPVAPIVPTTPTSDAPAAATPTN